jgi:hypothetical protein
MTEFHKIAFMAEISGASMLLFLRRRGGLSPMNSLAGGSAPPCPKRYSVHSKKRASNQQRVHTRTALLSLLDSGRISLVTFCWRGSPIVLVCVLASRPCCNLHCRSPINASQQRAHGSNRTRIALIWPICSRRIHSFRYKRTHLCPLRIAILGN